MTEKLLHFIWRFQYFNRQALATTLDEPIEIIHPGQHNHHQGPDFLQARVRIGTTLLAGSVELHLRTSDWNRHQHSGDPNYHNVVLHVVYEHDGGTSDLPVLELQPRISGLLLEHYQQLMQSNAFIPCGSGINQVPKLTLEAWKERLLAERLQRKAGQLAKPVSNNQLHWDEGFWHLLARSFGARTNAEAFEAIARSLPLKILARHSNSIHQLEAMLLGQARLLDYDYTDDYPRMLQREYRFLQQKWNVKPISLPVHFLRMRPSNFPTIRLAQLAALVQQSAHLFSKVIATTDVKSMEQLFQATANDYWHYHYRFDETTPFQPKRIGEDMIHHLLINVVSPVLFAYGSYHKNAAYTQRAVDILEHLPAENNAITRGFRALAIRAAHAADAQALLELRNNYCNERRCLECGVGNSLLKKALAIATH
ncbi:Protein of unknown function [Cnuella takakiae]|uniref:DUF2851 domain-containing protein n=1 Tax=Cnuella takakiae TaxID=1302690 RepID=A0A1M4V180_9BACT|nr:DUF2851 family protein [Cnuella takakiae]OLY94832.1 hypothetical protein BUE76_13180 [Cnuella takakiae]SHE62734.1 Protein of unknown function [Cnuella takakiae]